MENLNVTYKNERYKSPASSTEAFEQQYSPLYALRIYQLRPLLLRRMKKEWVSQSAEILPKVLDLLNSSPVEGSLSSVKYVVGCICKDTPVRPSFLKDYTKYVIPSTLEVEAQEGGDISELMTSYTDEKISFEEMEKKLMEVMQERDTLKLTGSESQAKTEAYTYLMNLYRKERIWFEDESGRVEIDRPEVIFTNNHGVNPLEVVTGMVIAAEGRLNHHNGKFIISRWLMAGTDDLSADSFPAVDIPNSKKEDAHRYVAFVSTLDCCLNEETVQTHVKRTKIDERPKNTSESYRNLLINFLKGQCCTEGKVDPHEVQSDSNPYTIADVCRNIRHVVLCGGLIPDCNDASTGTDGKHSAFEVAQRRSQIRLDSDETVSDRESVAINMQQADEFLSKLIDEVTPQESGCKHCEMHLCVMPSHKDPSNLFYPQQSLYSFCLPKTVSKRREHPNSSWKVELATNPNEFSVNAQQRVISILGTSGENIQDCMRYSHNLIPEIDWIERTLLCRHICPTAPDTLPCFPYRVKGAKKFGKSNTPENTSDQGVTSDPFCLVGDPIGSTKEVPDVLFAGGCSSFATRYLPNIRRRLIAVPKFSTTHSFCVMNIDSPTLETFEIRLDVSHGSNE